MVAMSVLLLLHEPPAGVLLSVVVRPAQTLSVPVIVVGNALTVIGEVAEQPQPTHFAGAGMPGGNDHDQVRERDAEAADRHLCDG